MNQTLVKIAVCVCGGEGEGARRQLADHDIDRALLDWLDWFTCFGSYHIVYWEEGGMVGRNIILPTHFIERKISSCPGWWCHSRVEARSTARFL